ncbi:MAG: protein-disulfide reductase DsbD family protein [Planctomycetia bacterium]
MPRTPALPFVPAISGLLIACLLAACPVVAETPVSGGAVDPLATIAAGLGSPIDVEAVIEKGGNGGPDVLAVTAVLQEGWHLYSLEQKPGGPKATKIVVAEDSPQAPAGPFQPDQKPRVRTVDDVPGWKGLVVEEHSGRVTWRATLAPRPAGKADAVHGTVSVQLCRDNACTPPETLSFTASDTVAAAPAGSGTLKALPPAAHVPERGHVKVEASFGPSRPGMNGRRVWPLIVRLVPEEHYHLYAPTSKHDSAVGQGKPTIVSVAASETVRAVRLTTLEAIPSADKALAAVAAVDGAVAIEVLLEPVGDAAATAKREIEAILGFQTCTDSACDPPSAARLTATLPSDDDPMSGTVAFAAARYAEAAKAPAAIEPLERDRPRGASISQAPARLAAASTAAAGGISLPTALLMGLAGGLILNLMPCVLPVLGLKLMSFAQQSGRARQEVFQMNLWYCAGLFAVFFVLATASVAANIGLGSENLAWGEQFTSTRFNVTMAAIVFAFALSFLGVWELPIPGFIGEKAGHVQSKEGPLGAFLKGVLSTVLATPCSGPFLGPVFGFTLSQPTYVTYAVFGAIATGMALPYLLVGLFPGLVKFLPKPGAWMETLKEVLGFVMLGTVVFLFTFLDHDYFVPTFALLVGIWAACWWVGRAQEANGGAGFGRWVQAAALAAAVGSVAFAFLGPVKSVLPWEPFSRARLAELREQGATVLVDFSADWCMTCKLNLATAIETNRVKAAIDANRVVPLLADWTEESPEIKGMLETLQSRSIPVLAIFPAVRPDEPARDPIVLRDLITESQVLEAIEQAGPSRPTVGDVRAAALP